MVELTESSKEYVMQRLRYAAEYIGDLTNDWLIVKSHIIRFCAPSYRSLFSRRHKTTKKHTLNDFELFLINEWYKITGVMLYLSIDKRHDPNWVQKGTGWYMSENHAELYRGKRAKKQKNKQTS